MKGVVMRWALILTALTWGVGACDDEGPLEPTTGTIRVTTVTSGADPDTDGYTVSVDGGAALAIDTTAGFLVIGTVDPGSHSVELGGVAANCSVDGSNPLSVSVVAGDTALAAFSVTCTALGGTVQVRTVTTGDSLDADGYLVRLGGDSATVGANDSVTFADVPAGDQAVTIEGIAPNCTAAATSQTVSVSAGATATADFSVACVAPVTVTGTVIVATTTTGDSLDTDGYSVTIGSLSDSIGINDTLTIEGVPAGLSLVQLGGVAANCSVAAADTVSITLLGDDTANVSYAVTCTAPAPVSPDRIAFTSDRDGNDEVYIVQTDGSGAFNLSNDAAADGQAAWSPDSTRVAFRSDRDGNGEIYVVNADGTGLINLTNDAGDDRQPAWSPDGTRIAFVTDRDGNDEVYLMNADGSGLANLTGDTASDSAPAWSADGTRIAFVTERDGNAEVYAMDADGQNPTNLTNDAGADSAPAWSPDGTKIAFSTDRDGNAEVYVMDADGQNATNLTNNAGADSAPSWSPDGLAIAFGSDRDGNAEIYWMNADGTGAVNLTNDPASDRDPSWGAQR
ncbi:MAG: hypothetical protein R3E10_10750 [Gemmatimonadota bacterium]